MADTEEPNVKGAQVEGPAAEHVPAQEAEQMEGASGVADVVPVADAEPQAAEAAEAEVDTAAPSEPAPEAGITGQMPAEALAAEASTEAEAPAALTEADATAPTAEPPAKPAAEVPGETGGPASQPEPVVEAEALQAQADSATEAPITINGAPEAEAAPAPLSKPTSRPTSATAEGEAAPAGKPTSRPVSARPPSARIPLPPPVPPLGDMAAQAGASPRIKQPTSARSGKVRALTTIYDPAQFMHVRAGDGGRQGGAGGSRKMTLTGWRWEGGACGNEGRACRVARRCMACTLYRPSILQGGDCAARSSTCSGTRTLRPSHTRNPP